MTKTKKTPAAKRTAAPPPPIVQGPLTSRVNANIRKLREKRCVSQARVADAADISVSYLSMLERNRRSPPLETLASIAKALDVTPAALLA